MKPVIIVSTYPNKKFLIDFSNELLENKIIACVNFSKISSIYLWKNSINNASEFLAIFKTTIKHKEQLKRRIEETHPYDVPEITEIDILSINNSYLKWLVNSTN